mmetsp:Transcript_36861/g.95455  ORF Transcript_36861/g.95455 Transcript_36861/m.95455 type:complete len:202 (-) Transcript_36861:193-798(-)
MDLKTRKLVPNPSLSDQLDAAVLEKVVTQLNDIIAKHASTFPQFGTAFFKKMIIVGVTTLGLGAAVMGIHVANKSRRSVKKGPKLLGILEQELNGALNGITTKDGKGLRLSFTKSSTPVEKYALSTLEDTLKVMQSMSKLASRAHLPAFMMSDIFVSMTLEVEGSNIEVSEVDQRKEYFSVAVEGAAAPFKEKLRDAIAKL